MTVSSRTNLSFVSLFSLGATFSVEFVLVSLANTNVLLPRLTNKEDANIIPLTSPSLVFFKYPCPFTLVANFFTV